MKKDLLVSLWWALVAFSLAGLLRSFWGMGLDWLPVLASVGAAAGSTAFMCRREKVLFRRSDNEFIFEAAVGVALPAFAALVMVTGVLATAYADVAATRTISAAFVVAAAFAVAVSRIQGHGVVFIIAAGVSAVSAVGLIFKTSGDIGLAITTVSATFTVTCALIGLIYAWRVRVLKHQDCQTKRTEAITRAVVAEAITEAVEPVNRKLDQLMADYRNAVARSETAQTERDRIIADLVVVARDLASRADDEKANAHLQNVLNALIGAGADIDRLDWDLKAPRAQA